MHLFVSFNEKNNQAKTYFHHLEQPSCPSLHAMQMGVLDENVMSAQCFQKQKVFLNQSFKKYLYCTYIV